MASSITVKILGDAKQFDKAAKDVKGSASGIGKSVAKIGAVVGGAFAAGAVLDFAQETVNAAKEDQAAAAKLATQLKNTTGARQADIDAAEEWIDKTQRATGVADDELRPALAKLAGVTKDVGEAQRLTALAMDISAGSGKDLNSVTDALMKAANGSVGGLSRLGIATKDASGKTKSFAQLQEDLAAQFKGATAAAAETAEGKTKRMSIAFGELKEKIGYSLLPILQKLADYMITTVIPTIDRLVGWLQDNVVPIVQKVVQWFKEHQAVTIALGVALAAIVAPIGTLVAAIIYAYTHFETFRNIVDGVLNVVRTGIRNFVGAVQAFWRTFGDTITKYALTTWNNIKLVVQGALNFVRGIIKAVTSLIRGDWSGAWNGIKQALSGVWAAIRGIVGQAINSLRTTLALAWDAIGRKVRETWDSIIRFFSGLPVKIARTVTNLFTGIPDAFRGAINAVIDIWNGLEFKIGGQKVFGKKLPSVTIGTPDLPHLAQGGIVSGPKSGYLAVLHGTERVTPLNGRNAGASVVLAPTIVQQPGQSPEAVVSAFRTWVRRNGPREITQALGIG